MSLNPFKKIPTLNQELELLLDEVRRKRIAHQEDEHWNRKQKEYYAEREQRIKEELGHDKPVQQAPEDSLFSYRRPSDEAIAKAHSLA